MLSAKGVSKMENRISLVDAIASLRKELIEAQRAGQAEAMRLVVDGAEIELQVGMTKEGTAGGKVSFWVYSVEAAGKLSSEVVQTVRLKLRPVGAGGGPIDIAADSGPPNRSS